MGVEDALRAAVAGGPDPGTGSVRHGGGGAVGEARECTVLGEITVPGVRRSVGVARRFVRDLVPGFPGLDDLITVVSETVANAVTHTASGLAGGRVTVVLAAGDGVYRLEVADDGAAGGRPHVKTPHVRDGVGAETGRGMRIVAALSSRWGFRADGPRTVVWAEFPATATAPAPAPAAQRRDRGREAPLSGPG